MTDIELASRFTIAVLLALLGAVLLRDHRHQPAGLLSAFFALAGVADQIQGLQGARLGTWGALVQMISLSAVVSFWLLAKSLFDDAFRWRWSYLFVLIALEISVLGAWLYTDGYARVADRAALDFDTYRSALIPQQLFVIVLGLLALSEAVRGWANDLVEARRRLRAVFLIVVGSLLLWVSFSSFFRLGLPRDPALDTAGNGIALVLLLAFIASLIRMRPEILDESAANVFPGGVQEESHDPMIQNIKRLMKEERLYCEQGLTIGRLADALGEKEYRVRRIINGTLGFRNFNQFLNRYRIAAASEMLVSGETRRLPVLTIAIDVGYGSLAPFNKAFKEAHAMTPTEYRRRNA